MAIHIRISCIAIVLGSVLIAPCAAFGAEEGLVAHFKFDEGSGRAVRDASGNNHHGTIHGAEYVELQHGYALLFDGEDDYVEVPDSESLRLSSAVTVEAWVNVSHNSNFSVLSKNGCSELRQNYWIGRKHNDVRFTLVDCPEYEMVAVGEAIQPNRWNHLAGSYDGKTVRVYVNGAQTGSLESTFEIGTFKAPFYIGVSSYGPKLVDYFTGKIDEVKVYSRALSGDQISSRYQAEKDLRISKLTRLMAEVSKFENRDTTPPALKLLSPPPDSTVTGKATISVHFGEKHSTVDVASVKIVLDGNDVTSQATITDSAVKFSPNQSFSDGIHHVKVSVADKAGNAGNTASWRFGVNAPVFVESRFDGDVFRVNGEPFFPLGVYSSNVAPSSPLPYLAQAAEAGINYKLIGGSEAPQMLDALLRIGMKGLVHVRYESQALGEGDPQPLIQLVNDVKDHPANLGWWNEYSSVNQKPLAVETYETVKAHDTKHPVLYMLSWGGELSDAYFDYAYPILNPLLPDSSIMSEYDITIKRAIESSRLEGKGKHVWFVSQAFDYRSLAHRGKIVTLEGGFRPNREELRAINYLAVAKGVKGLLYYAPGGDIPGTDYVDDFAIYPRQWTEALKIASEIRHLTPVLAAGEQVHTVKLEQQGDAIHFIELKHEGTHTLIAVNVEQELKLAKWHFDTPVKPLVLFEDRAPTDSAQTLTDLFQPLEVHIYQW